MKKAAPRKGLFDRIRGEAGHLEDVVKRLVKQAPGFLAGVHEQIKKVGNEHVRPELARGIHAIAKVLDDVSGSLKPDAEPRGRRKKKATTRRKTSSRKKTKAGAGRGGRAAGASKASGRKKSRRRKKVAR